MIDRTKSDWYKDAIIYQTHIKAFQDSNNDGIGDFKGLASRLDHIVSLGVDTIWLLPFYPSPLRDDGYDIADYEAVNPSYGDMDDFRGFVEAAHERGLRVITELVINHTSDQHPWFERARNAPEGSSDRDFYVWSDTDEKWPETRIIFNDTERSNWTWDPVAEQYFWHRFYSHQPDLNFDHPPVMEEVLRIMKMWLDTGVDGLRLDAIPYLVERDGTNNENLPETHDVLKRIRADLDAHFPDRMLLAEANQWPEDTRPYFGEGDECHMGFHFPLMPRMYMALAQEDRHPITDIMRQTPAIPDECQWAIFLRNHDELTLEMVTDRERDYMWGYYANDRRARINMGIRRRLAPLMGNDRRKIELMNAMLFSMPGTPVMYYGDEIGMGDNYYLGDRDGVRTPMQWSADMNGGFSRANPQELYLPAIQDPVYGFQAVNVEAQEHQTSSLLNWMKTIIAVRNRETVFGRGEISFLYPNNRKILAFVRSHEGSDVLCVFNVSRSAQAVEMDLAAYKDAVPVELMSGNAFPPIGELPYLLTLPPFGFFWFSLSTEDAMPDWHVPYTEVLPEFVTLTCKSQGIDAALSPANAATLAADVLPDFLPLQRWFAAKGERIDGCEIDPGVGITANVRLAIARATIEGEQQSYLLPLEAMWGEDHLLPDAPTLPATLAKLRRTNVLGALVDATGQAEGATALIDAMIEGATTTNGDLSFTGLSYDERLEAAREHDPRPLGVEQSNVSLAAGPVLLKIYRRMRSGVQPEIEMTRYLTVEAGFANTPALLGEARLRRDGEDDGTVVAAAFDFVLNQGDGWSTIVDALARDIEDRLVETELERRDFADETWPYPLEIGTVIGQRTGEMHAALARETDNPDFGTEAVSEADLEAWIEGARAIKDRAFKALRQSDHEEAQALSTREADVDALFERLAAVPQGATKTRVHGDYHLGQLLVAQGDVYVIDFEGEPLRPIDERRARTSPWKDVAGMLRSFDYAAHAALDRLAARGLDEERAQAYAAAWRERAGRQFMDAWKNARGPADDDGLRDLFVLEKALYEIVYEAGNRPDWLPIPVRGVMGLLDG